MDSKHSNEMLFELRMIRKLLMLQLLLEDVPQKQIAAMLEISEATMSRMIPRGTLDRKKIVTKGVVRPEV